MFKNVKKSVKKVQKIEKKVKLFLEILKNHTSSKLILKNTCFFTKSKIFLIFITRLQPKKCEKMRKKSEKKVQKSDQKNDLFFKNLQKFSQLSINTKAPRMCSPKNATTRGFQCFCKNRKNRVFFTHFFFGVGFPHM